MPRAQTISPDRSASRSSKNKAPRSTRMSRKPASTTKAAATPHLNVDSMPVTEDGRLFSWFKATEEGFVTIYKAPALARIEWVKNGVGARDAKLILNQLRVPQGEALTALHIPVATVNRKARTNAHLSPAESERVLGLGRLLGQLQSMVHESGNPDGFDASAWLSAWISTPVPALGGVRPLDLMDTMTGQALISQMIAQMQSGTYA